jgi:hypothetical protein
MTTHVNHKLSLFLPDSAYIEDLSWPMAYVSIASRARDIYHTSVTFRHCVTLCDRVTNIINNTIIVVTCAALALSSLFLPTYLAVVAFSRL